MTVEQMRLPDLWLKRAMTLSVVPDGCDVAWISTGALARCTFAEDAQAPQFSHAIAGDCCLNVADEVYFLAAAFEYLVLKGPDAGFKQRAGRAELSGFIAKRGGSPALFREPILGTMAEFAKGLTTILRERADFDAKGGEAYFIRVMAERVAQEILIALPPRDAQPLVIGSPAERIVRQPSDPRPFEAREPIQFIVPPHRSRQKLFGFEMRLDDRVVVDPWEMVGGWFEPRIQPAGKPCFLLDTGSFAADSAGEFLVSIFGVDERNGGSGGLPAELKSLIADAPPRWPRGYKEAIASVTFMERQQKKHVRAENAERRHGIGKASSVTPPRLYQARYSVVAKRDT